MDSILFLDKSIKDSEDRHKAVSLIKALFGDPSGLSDFIDTSKFQCFFLQFKDAFLHIKETENPTSEDFVLNEDTGYYEFNLNKDKFSILASGNKVFLPETLFMGVYFPNKKLNRIPLSWIKDALEKTFPHQVTREYRKLIDPQHDTDIYLNGKEFGDTSLYYSNEYSFLLRSFTMRYEKYKDEVDDSLISEWKVERTGILDYVDETDTIFDLNELCEDICQEMIKVQQKN